MQAYIEGAVVETVLGDTIAVGTPNEMRLMLANKPEKSGTMRATLQCATLKPFTVARLAVFALALKNRT